MNQERQKWKCHKSQLALLRGFLDAKSRFLTEISNNSSGLKHPVSQTIKTEYHVQWTQALPFILSSYQKVLMTCQKKKPTLVIYGNNFVLKYIVGTVRKEKKAEKQLDLLEQLSKVISIQILICFMLFCLDFHQ